jgi:fibronectin type 3 domain-containing protein
VTHNVTLTWVASTSPNIAGYIVYRGTTSGGPYAAVNTGLVVGTTYMDSSVQPGLTYYYVAKAVDTSGNESGYSTPATAVVPSP